MMGDAYSTGDAATYAACNVYDQEHVNGGEAMLTVTSLPEQFANVTLSQSSLPPVKSCSSQHVKKLKAASSQTVKVMVDACTDTSVLLVDASTNTPQYDAAVGLQQLPVSAETDIHTDRGTQLFMSHHPSSIEPLVSEHRLQNRSSADESMSKGWARCWSQQHELPPDEHVHNSCPCTFTNCPFKLQDQNADASSSSVAASNKSEQKNMQVSICVVILTFFSDFCK